MNSKNHRPMQLFIGLAIFTIVAGLTVFMSGQQRGQMANPQSSMHVPILTSGPQEEELPGEPDDWSFHHLIFTDPGTEEDAINAGRHEEWLRVVNDPRYIIQQLKRRQPAQGPWADYVAKLNERARAQEDSGEAEPSAEPAEQLETYFRPVKGHRPVRPVSAGIDRDWSMDLGSGAKVGAGQYPAKFSFWTTSASCGDYVVYPTGLAGTSSQATIVAYTNLYGSSGSSPTGCGVNPGGAVPKVYWAYITPVSSTNGTATLSPVTDWSGTQVAYVETVGSTAYLVLLHMANSGSTVTTPTLATSASNYHTGTNCAAPCYYYFSLGATDSNSPPFYDYAHDVMYVGDDVGKVHQFTTVFTGTPTAGWTSTSVGSTRKLTGPVLDPNSGGSIYFGDSGGYLYMMSTSGSVSATSDPLDHSTSGIIDAPVVDSASSSSFVYVLISYGGDSGHHSYLNVFNTTSTTFNSSYGVTNNTLGIGSSSSTPLEVYAGAFDNQHTSATNGNYYVCAGDGTNGTNPTLYQIAIGNSSGNPSLTLHTYNSTSSGAGACSPVTEFLGTTASTTDSTALNNTDTTDTITVASTTGFSTGNYVQIGSEIMSVTSVGSGTLNVTRAQLGTTKTSHASGATVSVIHDWLYVSVSASGNTTGCTGACLYNFDATAGSSSGSATAGLAVTGGASGIIIDNNVLPGTLAGASQIYFSSLANESCAGNGSTGSGTGGCAVQASQSSPSGPTTATGTVTYIQDSYYWPGHDGCTGTCSPTASVTVGATTYSFVTAINGTSTQVLTYDNGSTSQDESDAAQNLAAAIMNNSSLCSTDTGSPCFHVSGANASVTATHSSAVTSLTAINPGSGGDFTLTTNYSTGITVSGGNNGSP